MSELDKSDGAALPILTNAFTPEYLERLREQNETPSSVETEAAGPWELRGQEGAYPLFRVWEGFEHGDSPEAVFQLREAGLIFFAVRPAAGREPLFRPLEPETEEGFAIESGGEVVGHLRFFDQDWLRAAHVAACLARSPIALAALLEAGGPLLQEQVGRILGRSLLSRQSPPLSAGGGAMGEGSEGGEELPRDGFLETRGSHPEIPGSHPENLGSHPGFSGESSPKLGESSRELGESSRELGESSRELRESSPNWGSHPGNSGSHPESPGSRGSFALE